MIIRTEYLEKIKPFIGKPMIKAITGLRRVGKSVFIHQIMEMLKADGIDEKNLIYINMESLDFEFIRTYQDLNRYVIEKSSEVTGKIYIFVDEVQDIVEWEKTIASWSGDHQRYDITITGSNSTLFAGNLATKLTGRYVEFPVYPLSFKEFSCFFPKDATPEQCFESYIRFGGLPGIHAFEVLTETNVFPYLEAVQDSIVLKDVVDRCKIRNVSNLERICNFTYDNIGQLLSAQSISKFLKNQQLEVNLQSTINYLDALISAQLFQKTYRYDIKGKKQLEISHKFYATDLGLRNSRIGFHANDIAQVMENLVFLELRRQGFTVFIGQLDKWEIDFVAEKQGQPHYYQVTVTLADATVTEREVRPLLAIDDNYPKTIITLTPVFGNGIKGIEVVSFLDFLTR